MNKKEVKERTIKILKQTTKLAQQSMEPYDELPIFMHWINKLAEQHKLTINDIDISTKKKVNKMENTKVMTIKEYAKKWDRNIDNNFAVACYNNNSLFALEDTHTSDPDLMIMKTWGIADTKEYYDAVKVALIKRERE